MVDMERFTDDILIGILLNLPVKSLARFRCVSKHFYNLIQSPEFIDMHLNCEKKETVLLKLRLENHSRGFVLFHPDESFSAVVSSERGFSFPEFNFHVDQFVGSDRSGLVFVTSPGMGAYLCNPALRECRRIPYPPISGPFDYFRLRYNSGFGFDPTTKVYKIIHLVEFISDTADSDDELEYLSHRVAVLYDVKNDSWRQIVDFEIPESFVEIGPGCQLSFNGVCHWIACEYPRMLILCFDVISETFGWIQFPDEVAVAKGKRRALLLLHESLAIVQFQHLMYNEAAQLFDIWVMKDYGVHESWVKIFTVGPLPVQCPLAFLTDGRLLMVSTDGILVLCTPETNEIHELGVSGIPDSLGAVLFRESLVSVASLFRSPD